MSHYKSKCIRIHALCMCEAKALTRLHICAGWSGPSLLADAIRIKLSLAGIYIKLPIGSGSSLTSCPTAESNRAFVKG